MPPAIDLTDSQHKNKKVTVHLSDINIEEQFPDRILTLEYPNWTVEIGRGSNSDDTIVPGPNNGWFTSKVMSRQHAALKADPEKMLLTIKDSGSMHGTYLNGERVAGEHVELLQDDTITFGTDIVRQTETFAPLKTRISYDWSEVAQPQARNHFTIDYSEEEIYSDIDDDVEIVQESIIREPSVEILEQKIVRPEASSATTSPSMRSDPPTSSSSLPTSSPSIKMSEMKLKEYHTVDDSEEDHVSDSGCEPDDYAEYESEGDYLSESESFLYGEPSEADEQEVIPSSVPEEAPSMLSLPQEKVPRLPSPSDAAMAKPRPASPRIPAPYQTSRPSFVCSYTGRDPYSSSGLPEVVTAANPASWSNSSRLEPYSSSSFDTNGTSTFWGWGNGDYYSYQPYTTPSEAYPMSTSLLASTTLPRIDQLPRLSSEHSFNSQPYCLPDTIHPSSPPPNPRPPKRKADELSDSIDTTSGTKSATNVPSSQPEPATTKSPVCDKALPEDSPLRPNLTPVANTLRAKVFADLAERTETARLAVEKSVESLEANLTRERAEKANEEREAQRLLVIERAKAIVEGPARKKVKFDESTVERRNGGSMGKKIVSYAATALAGATVGALGAVVGLASLPPDYFA